MPYAKRNIAATAWASGNTPKGIPLGALTARSAAFLFICQNIKSMNYKTKRELIERKEEAVAKVMEFLRDENDYQSIMTQMALAQRNIMELMDTATAHGHSQNMSEITIFLSTIQCLMLELRDLSDYAKIEKSDE